MGYSERGQRGNVGGLDKSRGIVDQVERKDQSRSRMQRARALLLYWRERAELRALLIGLLLCGGLWGFMSLAGEVVEGNTYALDARILLALRNPADLADPIGPPAVEEMLRDLTALGGTAIITLVTVGVVVYLFLVRRYTMAWLMIVAVGGGYGLNVALKAWFDRPRPDLAPHYTEVYNASFPSGHSMLAATVYLTLGVLLARIQTQRRTAVFIMAMALLITVLVGVSRVYLGVHWPSDVLAGWMAGALWAMFAAIVARRLQFIRMRRRNRAAVAETTPGPVEEKGNPA